MKKNLITLIAAVSILASSTAVFAENTTEATTAPEAAVETTVEAPVSTPSYISNTVTVKEMAEGTISTVIDTESTDEINNVINFNTDENTLVFTDLGEIKTLSDIKKDDVITVFTSANEPATLQLPASYKANVVIIKTTGELNVNVDKYLNDGETLVNAANTLALNIGEATTHIADTEGYVTDEELANKDLIVFYGNTTRSIPAQTTPEKVFVIGEKEVAAPETTTAPESTEAPAVETVKASTSFTAENGTVMVPLREIAQTLGFTVAWDGETRSVMLNDGKYSLKIDENKYTAGRAMPVELGSAPVIKNDLTFVPVEYFTQVLEVAEGTIVTE